MKHLIFILTMGFALFSMHFGAGNLVYPLELGCTFGAASLPALCGLLVTAVGFPAVGFLSMILFQGEPKAFFGRFGPIVATLMIAIIVAVLGPFGSLSRCVALTYTITQETYSGLSLEFFSAFSCLVIFALLIRKNSVIALLGKFLTPLLLLTLVTIMIGGLFSETSFSPEFEHSSLNFCKGIVVGYQTMDLLAALFFCHILFKPLESYSRENNISLFRVAFQTSCVASLLLILAYVGFGLLSAMHADLLKGICPELLLLRLSEAVLGKSGALLTHALVVFACLTTAMALGAIFADFLVMTVKLPYLAATAVTMSITYFVATMGFTGIVAFLVPILDLLYPILIVWSLYNLLCKKVTSVVECAS